MTDKLNQMWTALADYQSKADADGHGESWALMCSEKTSDAAYDATYAAAEAAAPFATYVANAGYAAWAAYAAAYAAAKYAISATKHVAYDAKRSIYYINKAQGETK